METVRREFISNTTRFLLRMYHSLTFRNTIYAYFLVTLSSAAVTEPPKNSDQVSLPMVTVDDLYYAVNVSIGTNSTNAQQFTLTVDIKGTDTTLADVSLKPRHGRGFVLHNASSVQENDPGYYLMKDYVQVCFPRKN